MSKSNSPQLARNIKHLMVRDGITQADLAAKTGIDAGALSRTLRGKRKWTLDDMEAVAEAFDISVPELFAQPEDLVRSRWFRGIGQLDLFAQGRELVGAC